MTEEERYDPALCKVFNETFGNAIRQFNRLRWSKNVEATFPIGIIEIEIDLLDSKTIPLCNNPSLDIRDCEFHMKACILQKFTGDVYGTYREIIKTLIKLDNFFEIGLNLESYIQEETK